MNTAMTQTNDSFAVFILSHGRADRVLTYDMLRRGSYTGRIYVVIDNEDAACDAYRARYGAQVVVFDKPAVAEWTDTGDNFSQRDSVVFARNACWQIAEQLNVEYFLVLDDDYRQITYRFTTDLRFTHERNVLDLDRLFATILEFYKSIPAATIAMGQSGDYIGGAKDSVAKQVRIKRKAMNSFFCSVHRPFRFLGRINEDTTTYCVLGNRGELFLTFFNTCIHQTRTQRAAGGLTPVYLRLGTYVKSFYSVMYTPAFVHVAALGVLHRRFHHAIDWINAVPCILDEKCLVSADLTNG